MLLLKKLQTIDYIYESIPSVYSKDIRFMVWLDINNKWKIQNPKGEWTDFTNTEEAFTYMLSNNLDLDKLRKHLDGIILTKGVLARKNYQETLQFFTDKDIDEAEAGWKDLMKGVIKLLENDTEPKIRLVKDEF